MPRTFLHLFTLFSLFSLTYTLFFHPNASLAQNLPQKSAHVGFLNKITGRFHDKIIPIQHTIPFETLFVRVEACYRSSPGEKNESVAFFHISDTLPDHTVENLFTGWMFASTPSLSSLEHSSYDIWLLACPRLAPSALNTTP